jgi:hypothetical protein
MPHKANAAAALHRTARIHLADHRISYTSTGLIGADAICKIVVRRTELIRTVTTHPGASGARPHRELNAVILRNQTDSLRIVLITSCYRGVGTGKECKESNKGLEHFYGS